MYQNHLELSMVFVDYQNRKKSWIPAFAGMTMGVNA